MWLPSYKIVSRQLDWNSSDICALLVLGIAASFAVRATYRLFFHPLRNFPGPKLAAVSHLYEFYHDVIRNGTYIEKIDQMHQKYGLDPDVFKDYTVLANILKGQL